MTRFPRSIASGATYIDPRGQRFGAGVSATLLAIAWLAGLPILVAALGVNLAASALYGTCTFLPGRPWPLIRRALSLGPAELEHDYPPRFAQALGATFLGFATAVFILGVPGIGWLLAAAVAGLQALLALTGLCVGCRLYFLRWWAPLAFSRLIGLEQAPQPVPGPMRLERPRR